MKIIRKKIISWAVLFSIVLYFTACKDNMTTNPKFSTGGPNIAPYSFDIKPTASQIGSIHSAAVPYCFDSLAGYSHSTWNALTLDSQQSVIRALVTRFCQDSTNFQSSLKTLTVNSAVAWTDTMRNAVMNGHISDFAYWASDYLTEIKALQSAAVYNNADTTFLVEAFNHIAACSTLNKAADTISSLISQTNSRIWYSDNGKTIAQYVIAIEQSSITDAIVKSGGGNPPPIAWWAVDAVGGLIGAGSSLLGNLFNGESANWGNAAAWGLGGAVGASTLGLMQIDR